jgi:iron(III) transport system ATP-binding protein
MIELSEVTQRYGPQVILNHFSHRFITGSMTAISGPSGIGKTTLLQVISGFLPIGGGQISIDGQITDTAQTSVHPSQRRLGFVFQFPALWPHLSVRQNILYGLRGQPRAIQEQRLAQMLDDLAIAELANKRPSELSGGQARRVSLARTLITEPRHLLLDEPLNNLDARLKDQVLAIVDQYARQHGATVIWVTHDPGEVIGLAAEIRTFSPSGLI